MVRRILKWFAVAIPCGILLGITLRFLEGRGLVTVGIPLLIPIGITMYVIILAYLLSKYIKRHHYITSLLYKHVDPDWYLEEINREKQKYYFKKPFLINESVGLMYKGEFQRALSILESINPDKLNKTYKAVYYNNLTYGLLGLGRVDDAEKAFTLVQVQNVKNKRLKTALKSTKAILDFHRGNLAESKQGFCQLFEGPLHNSGRAEFLFFLGQINLEEGDYNLGVSRLQEAKRIGAKTYIADRVDNILKEDELRQEE